MRALVDRLAWLGIILLCYWPLTLGVVAFFYLAWLAWRMWQVCGYCGIGGAFT
jgi:hypothetical protein